MSDLDTRLVRFIAVAVLSVVCLLHYFSNRFGLFMNKLFAMFKTVLLLTVFIAGMKASTKDGSGLADFGKTQGSRGAADGLSAMVLIFYAYQGWENANYVRTTYPKQSYWNHARLPTDPDDSRLTLGRLLGKSELLQRR